SLRSAGSHPHLALPSFPTRRSSDLRLVQQLLTLARLEQGQWRRQFEEVELKPLFGRVLERFHEKFADADMTLHSELCEATMEGDATLLDILLQNLLNNILNHCPVGTVAEVRLERVAPKQPGLEGQSGEELRLRVSDTGPGISPDLRRQMSRGFMRLDSKS